MSHPKTSRSTSRLASQCYAPGGGLEPDSVQISIIQTIIYLLSLTFTKLSVLCLYIRVLTYDYVRVAAKTLLGIVLISHIYILATLCTACIPFDAFWDFSKRETAFCQPMSVYWSHAGLNIVTDFLIFMLPLTVMHKIRTPRPQKIALLAIFILAFRFVRSSAATTFV